MSTPTPAPASSVYTDGTAFLSFDIGLRTLALSRATMRDGLFVFQRVDVFDLIQDDTINVASTVIECLLDRAVPNLVKIIPEILEGIDFAKLVVIIETQPTGRFAKNIKMKVVSHVLQSLLRTYIGPEPVIIFQSAHVKLQATEIVLSLTNFAENCDVPPVSADDDSAPPASSSENTRKRTRKAERSKHYRMNKKATVAACDLLNEDHSRVLRRVDVESAINIWRTVDRKKRDDCADAIWQFIGFVEFHRTYRAATFKRKKVAVKTKATTRKLKNSILSDLEMCESTEELKAPPTVKPRAAAAKPKAPKEPTVKPKAPKKARVVADALLETCD